MFAVITFLKFLKSKDVSQFATIFFLPIAISNTPA